MKTYKLIISLISIISTSIINGQLINKNILDTTKYSKKEVLKRLHIDPMVIHQTTKKITVFNTQSNVYNNYLKVNNKNEYLNSSILFYDTNNFNYTVNKSKYKYVPQKFNRKGNSNLANNIYAPTVPDTFNPNGSKTFSEAIYSGIFNFLF